MIPQRQHHRYAPAIDATLHELIMQHWTVIHDEFLPKKAPRTGRPTSQAAPIRTVEHQRLAFAASYRAEE
jgi:hypothetical protein